MIAGSRIYARGITPVPGGREVGSARDSSYAPMRKDSRTVKVKYAAGQPISAKVRRELAALAALPDSEIDLSDAPELPPEAWKNAVRGRVYRPLKQAISLRVTGKPLRAYRRRRRNV